MNSTELTRAADATPPRETWQDPALPDQILQNLEQFAVGLRATVEQQAQIKAEIGNTGQQMGQVFGAMSQLLDIMYERVVTPQPVAITPEALAPLAHSMTEAFGEINRRVHQSEERQMTALEATLRQIDIDRDIERTAGVTHAETQRVQTRLEINRLMIVLLISVAFAAAGVGFSFYKLL